MDLDTQLLEVEAGVAYNEPVTYAVRKVIEASVVELINAGEVKGLWSYKPEPWVNPGVVKKKLDPEVVEHIQGILDIIEEKEEVYDDYKKKPEGFNAPALNEEDMLPEGPIEIIEEEVYDDYKKKPEVVEVIEEVIEEEEKIEVMDIGDPPGQSNDNDLVEPVEEPNEEDTISTDTVIPTGPTDK